MNRRKSLYSIGLLVALVGGFAVAGSIRTKILFQGTFDAPEAMPEVGQFVASSSVGSIGILPSVSGGNVLVFDDTTTNGSQPLYLHGTFDGGNIATTGVVSMHLELTLAQSDSPFSVGVVVDNATSDFIPTGGPDTDGDLTIAGMKSGKKSPVDIPMAIDVRLERERPTHDWEYEITVTTLGEPNGVGKLPSPSSVPFTGTFAGTAGKNIAGLAFIKLPGPTGRFFVDDISVAQKTH